MIILLLKNIRSYWSDRLFPPHLWREVACIFLASAGFFALLAGAPSFPDPDSFYHARIAALMIQGPVLSFPWLPFTALATGYIDHHFLYHIALIPFVAFGDPLIGLKIATVFFAASFIALLYWMMRAGRPHAPISRMTTFLFLCILLINTVFTFRINLAKIPAVSLFVFFCGIHAAGKKNLKALFGLSFLFVWLYGGWPLMPMMAIVAWTALSGVSLPDDKKWSLVAFANHPHRLRYCKERVVSFLRSLVRREHAAIPLVSFAGAAGGLVLNPYFPTNLVFYWVQTIKIAVLNIISDIPVGAEWYPPGMSFVPAHGPTLMILIFALCVFFLPGLFSAYLGIRLPRRTWQDWLLCLLALAFFVLTLKSRRYGEYFAPLATLFSAYILAPALGQTQWMRFWHVLIRNMSALASPRGLATGYFLVMIPAIITVNITQIAAIYRDGYGMKQYARGMEWLAEHTPADSLVFNNRWDDFPLFFYHNQHNAYISGLDPRFLLERDAQRARDYTTIQQGDDFEKLYGYRPLCLANNEAVRKEKRKKGDASLPAECVPEKEKQALARALKSFGSPILALTHLDYPSTKKIRGLPGLQELYRDDGMVLLSLSR
ncbi:hypothetical protein HY732_03050 [Candidatus Uhrbacteria bacterium]|nr:hypothetical protein [Candidatus Uhrbacteria bacterium]